MFLCHIGNGNEVRRNRPTLETMYKWPVPAKKKEVQRMLGYSNYYRLFIENYSAKACLLIDRNKGVPFSRVHHQQRAFDELRTTFSSACNLT